jgi:NTP pyrophosphatase (non-canonical NTP hydrolase)
MKDFKFTTGLYNEEPKHNNEKIGYTIEQYQKEASRTFLSKGSRDLDVLHCLVGMQTELGELADPFKKEIFYGKELDKTNVAEELADMFWYAVNLARIEQIDLVKALQNNIAKLKVRFPEKFTEQNAIERNLEAEREQLEK